MSPSFEALGMSLMHSSTMASPDAEKVDSAGESAKAVVNAIRKNIRPRDIITRKSIENVVSLVMATGGCSNAGLHYVAVAAAGGVQVGTSDLHRARRQTAGFGGPKPSRQ